LLERNMDRDGQGEGPALESSRLRGHASGLLEERHNRPQDHPHNSPWKGFQGEIRSQQRREKMTDRLAHADWSLIPQHMRASVRRWIEHGVLPGGFLSAVIRNDLVGAVRCAD